MVTYTNKIKKISYRLHVHSLQPGLIGGNVTTDWRPQRIPSSKSLGKY